jgi:hypothetical protein
VKKSTCGSSEERDGCADAWGLGRGGRVGRTCLERVGTSTSHSKRGMGRPQALRVTFGARGGEARNTREYPLHLAFEAREGVAATKSLVFGAHREVAREGALNPPWS